MNVYLFLFREFYVHLDLCKYKGFLSNVDLQTDDEVIFLWLK